VKRSEKDRIAAFCSASGMPAATAESIVRHAAMILRGLSPIHGITKTWVPWVLQCALLSAVQRETPGASVKKLLREYGNLLPRIPRLGPAILRRALKAAEDVAGRGRGALPPRGNAETELALRIAAVVALIPARPADREAPAPLLAVRDMGACLDVVIGRRPGGRARSAHPACRLWKRIAGRTVRLTVGDERNPLPDPHRLSASDPPAVAGAKILADELQRFTSRQYGLRLGSDPEFVHELRVCTRRMRAALKLFGGSLGDWAAETRNGLSAIAAELGAIRDADVLGAFLQRYLLQCPAHHRPFVEDMLRSVRNRAGRHLQVLTRSMEEPGRKRFIEALSRRLDGLLSEAAQATRAEDSPTVARAAPRWLRGRLKTVLAYSAPLSLYKVKQLHQLRIACKWLRYTAEFLAPVYPGGLEKIIRLAAGIQEHLGDVRDADLYSEAIGLYRRRRTDASKDDDAAAAALAAHLEVRHIAALEEAEALWIRFADRKGKRAAVASIRRPYPARDSARGR
jgi:CHAD domain-containing protein